MSEDKPSFWTSLQGILTGVASVIAAVTGLVVALHGGDPATDTGNTAADTAVTAPAPANTQPSAPLPHTLPASGGGSSGASGTTATPAKSRPVATPQANTSLGNNSGTKVSMLGKLPDLMPEPTAKPSSVHAKSLQQVVDCNSDKMLNNSVPSLMSWSKHYFSEAQAHKGDGRLRADCEKLLQYRASAWCKDHSSGIRDALLQSLKLCRVNDTLAAWYRNR